MQICSQLLPFVAAALTVVPYFTAASFLPPHSLHHRDTNPVPAPTLPQAGSGGGVPTLSIDFPKLPYAYDALEPIIPMQIMQLHHDKHFQAYHDKYVETQKKFQAAVAANDVEAQVSLWKAIRFNGGGFENHVQFFQNLCSPNSKDNKLDENSALGKAINAQFGGLEKLIQMMIGATDRLDGVGWIWLIYTPKMNRLYVDASKSQDPLRNGQIGVFGIDVWEHAYYLKYLNSRADYLNEIWKVINWTNIAARYDGFIKNRATMSDST